MELDLPSFLVILFTFLLYLFMSCKMGKRLKIKNKYSNLPPGPRKLPIIGNLHQLVGSLPHRTLADLAKKYGPCMHLQLGEISCIVISSSEFAKEVMHNRGITFASRPPNLAASAVTYDYRDIAFAPYGAYWRQLRKICVLEVLSMKRVQSFRSIREEEMSKLTNHIASKAGSVINLTDRVKSTTSDITARAALGKRCQDQQSFFSIIKTVVHLLLGLNIADLFPSVKLLQFISGMNSQLEKLHKETDRILENIINEHKKLKSSEEDEDLVDILLKIQEQGDLEFPLTTANIKAVILDIFAAGTETSSTIVDWAMAELVKNPRWMRRAQAEVREVFNRKGKADETGINELKFLKLVIKETLRFHPPLPLLAPRESQERCEINGFKMPAKTRVFINQWAMGRDPQYWTEPEIFNPERFLDSSIEYNGKNFEFIPFGAGRRICPGISFGMANVEIILAMLLYHFDWELPNGIKYEDLDMTECFGAAVERKQDLLVIPIPYHPPPFA